MEEIRNLKGEGRRTDFHGKRVFYRLVLSTGSDDGLDLLLSQLLLEGNEWGL